MNQTKAKEVIPIFFTIDDSYAPYLGVALKSLIANASRDYEYNIHIIHEDLSEENQKILSDMAEEGFHLSFKKMENMMSFMNEITDREENLLRCDYFTMTIYFRIFLADMFPEYDKGIYIDSDIVVPGDISKMYNLDLEDNIIGACPDHSVCDVPELANYMENAIGTSRYKYINSGVLLMNMKKMRDLDFSKKFLKLLNTYHFDCIAPDQDYINAMCMDKILFLDEIWDAMPNDDKPPVENPSLIHYNLFDKPWCYPNIMYEDYFWKYAKQTPYYEWLLNHRDNYPEEQIKSDQKSFNYLVEKADAVPSQEVTFKKVYENGSPIRA